MPDEPMSRTDIDFQRQLSLLSEPAVRGSERSSPRKMLPRARRASGARRGSAILERVEGSLEMGANWETAVVRKPD